MATVLGGQSYSVDKKGNVYKNGVFVPAENMKYIPGQVLNQAKDTKSGGTAATSTSNGNSGSIVATSSGSAGAVNYAQANDQTKKMLELQRQKELNDPNYKASEIQRTLGVINDLKSKGQDYTAQEKYLKSNLGYNPNQSVDSVNSTGSIVSTGSNTGATGTAQNYINQLTEAQKQKVLADLGKSRDAALSNLNAERSSIAPKYYDARNQAASGSQLQARNFAEYMAARGGTRSGAAAQAELMRQGQLQGTLGNLNQQETQNYADIARRSSDVQNAYASDVASANAGIEASKVNSLLNDYYTQQQRELQIAQLMGVLNGQRTLAGQQYDQNVAQQNWQNQFNYGQATGTFGNGQHTMDYTNMMANLTGRMPDGTLTNTAQQQQLGNLWQVAQATGTIPNQLADLYGLPHGTRTQDALIQAAQLAISQQNANTASQNASNSAANQNYDNLINLWKATGSAPAGIPGVAPGTPYGGSASAADPQNTYTAKVVSDLNKFTNFADAKGFLEANSGDIIATLGLNAYNDLLAQAQAKFPQTTPNTTNNNAVRQKAVDAAMKNPRWNALSDQEKQQLVDYYLKLYTGG